MPYTSQIWQGNHMQTKSKDHTPSKVTSHPASSQITKPHPSIQQYKGQKTSSPKPQHPTKQPHLPQTPTKQTNYTPANFSKNKITPKASQTADLNCLNFKLIRSHNSCRTAQNQEFNIVDISVRKLRSRQVRLSHNQNI